MPRPMLARVLPLLLFLGGAAAGRHNVRGDGGCVYPGVCQPPVSQHSRVSPVTPRQQWNIDGGYCGSLSIQTGALAHGAWLSQAVVRKANYGVYAAGHCDGGQPGHPGELQSGCEVGIDVKAICMRTTLYICYIESRRKYTAWCSNDF